MVINCDLIEFIESTPDTVITMTTGKKVLVLESVDEVISSVVKYRRKTHGVDPNFDSVKGECL